MENLFLEILKLSLIGSLLALTVILVRMVFRKAPRWIFCLLWGLVALRLVLPFSIQSQLSFIPEAVANGEIITHVGEAYIGDVVLLHENSADYHQAIQAGREPIHGDTGYYVVTEKGSYNAPATVEEALFPALSWVWLGGVGIMLSYLIVTYLLLKRKMAEATHLRENIWQCEQVDSPFVLGLIRPKIYLPYQISLEDLQNVLAHEQAHIHRKDHWWKPLGFVLLCIHWFNPVLWLAYTLLCRDIEAACDEKVIQHMTKEEMRTYSTALLNCSMHRRRIAACPLAFGETSVKERIKHVMNYKKPAFWIVLLAVAVSVAVSAVLLTDPVSKLEEGITPIEETYTYTIKHKNYLWPATVDGWAEKDAMLTENEDGTFFCFTEDATQADNFVNTQRTLLHYLKDLGISVDGMDFYGTDYGFSFSNSQNQAAYIDLHSTSTWQQVLVTLQAIWGDYTDYGYVYAMSNAIADVLGWQADTIPVIEKSTLDTFFTENPDSIELLYPTFSEKFASAETVSHSKALALDIFEELNWRKQAAKPIGEQLEDYSAALSLYAKKISIPFNQQTCSYAFYGEAAPLRILTTYAQLIIDANYKDAQEAVYGDYFSNYKTIYETAANLNEEISASVARLGLEEEAGVITIKFLDKDAPSTGRYIQRAGSYSSSTGTVYVNSLWLYLHQYHEHLAYLLTKNDATTWQSQAFCEIGSTHSQYFLRLWEDYYTQEGPWTDTFVAYAGHPYEPGLESFYEMMDILCYSEAYYELVPNRADPMHSLTRYLMDKYSEETVVDLMLHPETVEGVTGKTWDDWQIEWQQFIQLKYAGVVTPE